MEVALPKLPLIPEEIAWKQKMMTNQRVIVGMACFTIQEKFMYSDKLILIPMNFADTNKHNRESDCGDKRNNEAYKDRIPNWTVFTLRQ
jgi:hypothetical protein